MAPPWRRHHQGHQVAVKKPEVLSLMELKKRDPRAFAKRAREIAESAKSESVKEFWEQMAEMAERGIK